MIEEDFKYHGLCTNKSLLHTCVPKRVCVCFKLLLYLISRLSSLWPGGTVCTDSSSSSSAAQDKEVPGVQMGSRHSRGQTPNADLWDWPQHVSVIDLDIWHPGRAISCHWLEKGLLKEDSTVQQLSILAQICQWSLHFSGVCWLGCCWEYTLV